MMWKGSKTERGRRWQNTGLRKLLQSVKVKNQDHRIGTELPYFSNIRIVPELALVSQSSNLELKIYRTELLSAQGQEPAHITHRIALQQSNHSIFCSSAGPYKLDLPTQTIYILSITVLAGNKTDYFGECSASYECKASWWAQRPTRCKLTSSLS